MARNGMLRALRGFLDRRSPTQVVFLGVVLTASLGVVDYLAGYEISLSVFYLVPIALVTWYGQRWAGLAFCALSAGVWLFADQSSGHAFSNSIIPIWNAIVRLGFFLVTSYLLGTLKGRLRHEETLARTDGLTGVLNARAFRESASKLLEIAVRHHHPAALGYLDLDDFKSVNDAWGHSEGDRVIQTVGHILTRCIRVTDIVGRVGGDEFAVFLPETDLAGAHMRYHRMRSELAQSIADAGWPIGVSMGVAVFSGVPPTLEKALKIADRLMYGVKQSGKNGVIFEEQAGLPRRAG